MANSATSLISSYLVRTTDNLLLPLEIVMWHDWKEDGEGKPSGLELLRASFLMLAIQLSAADGDVAADELQVAYDVHSLFGETWDVVRFFSIVKRILVDQPEILTRISVPLPINYLTMYDQQHGTEFSEQAKTMFFRFANAILKADGVITERKEKILQAFRKALYEPNYESEYILIDQSEDFHDEEIDETPIDLDEPLDKLVDQSSEKVVSKSPDEPLGEPSDELLVKPFVAPVDKSSDTLQAKPLDKLLGELDSLIGLDIVKKDVVELINFIRVQQLRVSRGMKSVPISRHLVFLGNPGTGKTTIARLLARVYQSLNIVSKGHLVETDRSGLVAGYVGQTALKVKEVVTQALGGVLFIDEAYALAAGSDSDYGREAVDTLIKLMEDHRDDLIVVVAGYTDKMNEFLLTNPGLKSRFNKYFHFEDYSPAQLVEIFELFCIKADFSLSQDAHKKVTTIFQLLHDVRDESFGNARLARNVFERTANNHANRIIAIPDITESILSTIEAVDIPGEIELSFGAKQKSVQPTRSTEGNTERRIAMIEIVKKEPSNTAAWLELSELVDNPVQSMDCLLRVLKLEPSNQIARDRLNRLKM